MSSCQQQNAESYLGYIVFYVIYLMSMGLVQICRDLDFTLKVIGGDLSTLPGISDAIEETIRDAIEDSITWPVRKVIPILPGDYSNLELKPVGILEVKLVQAKNLTNKDIIGKSDPYAVIFVRPLRDRTKTSKIMNNQLNSLLKMRQRST
ncbi:hypothetical protein GLYMA_04G065450v4 [Glycine max]|nr:hypothetical protein GLYMA_04G065450v4 [Glycine max]KAH1110111.1 hypothetical protein GYH30_009143 [Glycine max]